MGGVFHSMLTQGHVIINRLLSTTHGYLGLFRSHGQRSFVELEDGWELLDLPSAFEMTPQGACWIYRHAGGLLEVRSGAPVDRQDMWLAVDVLSGPPRRLLVSNHLAINGDDGADAVPARFERDAGGISIALLPDTDLGRRFPEGGFRFDPSPGSDFERVGGDELLFEDGRSRGLPFLVLVTPPTRSLGLRITGQLVGDAPRSAPARDLRARAAADAVAAERFCAQSNRPARAAHRRGRSGGPRRGAARGDPAQAADLGATAAGRALDPVATIFAHRGDEEAALDEIAGWARAAAHFGRKSLRQK